VANAMMNLPEQLEEALTGALESIRLVIRKDSGEQENFDPEALLYSLFEAGIPIKRVFHILDRVLGRLLALNDLGEITERQLQGLVTTTISSYPDPDASVWVSNYHYAHALDTGLEQDDGGDSIDLISNPERLASARNAFLIRHLLKSHVTQELDVTLKEVTDPIDVEELREATNRILQFIRFSGLTEVRLKTLQSLIKELSAHSQHGDREKAMRWLGTPVRALDYATPISLLGTGDGATRVEDVLGRMEQGVW
jgi:hypothetical protein